MKNKDVENFLKENNLWGTQCFCTRNITGDSMEQVYNKDNVIVEYCEYWDYIEVFGLDNEDFEELEQAHVDAYNKMIEEYEKMIEEYEKKQNLCNV